MQASPIETPAMPITRISPVPIPSADSFYRIVRSSHRRRIYGPHGFTGTYQRCIGRSYGIAEQDAPERTSGNGPAGYGSEPGEEFTLAAIRILWESGARCRKIANLLNASGIPARNGGQWYPQTIKNIAIREGF